jgi:hypothetical protein
MVVFIYSVSSEKRKSQLLPISWLFQPFFDVLEWIGRLVCRLITRWLPVINSTSEPMSRKDYERIARALRIWRPSEPKEQELFLGIVYQIAAELKDDNPRFNTDRFLQAVDA